MPELDRSERFLARWPKRWTPEAELVYGIPRRQQQLIAIGQQQLELQQRAAREIGASGVAAAQIIAAELEQQTADLEECIESCVAGLASNLADAADQISAAAEVLGDRLCAHLGEIAWQLAQQEDVLRGILHTLHENRSNEARQLVNQGVRHYLNEQYDRAEERFQQALAQDTTDFQVLMNLGHLAVRKGANADAVSFFRDALRLPPTLDVDAKNRALMASARVHFLLGEYGKAASDARSAVGLSGTPHPRDVFALAIYAALAGEATECLVRLEEAILADPIYFAKAAVEPDLETVRAEVVSLLSRLALDTLQRTEGRVAAVQAALHRVESHQYAGSCAGEIQLVASSVENVSRQVSQASYGVLLHLQECASALSAAVGALSEAEECAAQQKTLECRTSELERLAVAAEDHLASAEHGPPFRIRSWFLWHLGTWIPVALVLLEMAKADPGVNHIAGLFMAPWFILGIPLWLSIQWLVESRASRLEVGWQRERRLRETAALEARSKVRMSEAERDGAQRAAVVRRDSARDLIATLDDMPSTRMRGS